MYVRAVILQLDHSLALYKRKQSFRRWQLATQPQVKHGVGPLVEALHDLEMQGRATGALLGREGEEAVV